MTPTKKIYSLNPLLTEFTTYLLVTRRLDEKTPSGYIRDIKQVVGNRTFENYQRLVNKIDERINSIDEWDNSSIATKKRRMSVLNTFFRFLKKTGKIEKAPHYTFSPAEAKPINAITLKEFKRFIACIPNTDYTSARDRAIFSLMFYSGIKESEVVRLEHKNFEPENRKMYIHINFGESYERRKLKVPKQAIEEVNAYKKLYSSRQALKNKPSLESETFFKNNGGEKISTRSIRRKLEKWAEISGIKITPTNLRHSYAQRQAKKVKTNKELAELLGLTTQSIPGLMGRLSLEQNQEP